jgi:class 3 adenylate cyclase
MDPQVEGQRKPVTAFFADVVDSTRYAERSDPEDWSAVLARVVADITLAVERYGGTVTQFLGDGLLAIFGAPEAHEDDPERAVRAGLEAVAAVERLARRAGGPGGAGVASVARGAGGPGADDLPLAIRVGINSGLAIVGEMPTGRSSAFTAIGDTVNVAARVEAAAPPGRVWVTAATRRLLGPSISVRDVGSIEAKGKSEPLVVHEIVGATEARPGRPGVPGLHSPLVGRGPELARLLEAVATVRAGRGRAALLIIP